MRLLFCTHTVRLIDNYYIYIFFNIHHFQEIDTNSVNFKQNKDLIVLFKEF